jgi:MerR family transcriptional regulator, light-induced transcriptional regulator
VPKPPHSQQEASTANRPTAPLGEPDAGSDLTWGVGAVSDRLGVTASTVRTWERRYGVGPSFRTQGGHRRYTDRDIDRVELMRRLVGRGVSAQDAARVARTLDREELRLALTDEADRKPVRLSTEDLVDAMMAAVVTGNLERLSELSAGLMRRGRLADSWRDVLAPVLVRMSLESSTGALPIESEAAATGVIIRELRGLVVSERLPETGSTGVLFARNVAEPDAVPLLALEAALSQAGVVTRTVGPETGTRSVASLVTRLRPDVLVTWGHPPDPPLRRAMEDLDGETFMVQVLPGWPHQMGLRFGFDAPLVSTDVAGAVERILDRVP